MNDSSHTSQTWIAENTAIKIQLNIPKGVEDQKRFMKDPADMEEAISLQYQ